MPYHAHRKDEGLIAGHKFEDAFIGMRQPQISGANSVNNPHQD
jgi:hypothetical protein